MECVLSAHQGIASRAPRTPLLSDAPTFYQTLLHISTSRQRPTWVLATTTGGYARKSCRPAGFRPSRPSLLHLVRAPRAVTCRRDRACRVHAEPGYPRRSSAAGRLRLHPDGLSVSKPESIANISRRGHLRFAISYAWNARFDTVGRAFRRSDRTPGYDSFGYRGTHAIADHDDSPHRADCLAVAFPDRTADTGRDQHAPASNSAAPDAGPDSSAGPERSAVTGHVTASAIGIADRTWEPVEDKPLERIIGILRFAAAAAILILGQTLPNVGALFVLVLGVFFGGYGLLVGLAWARVRTPTDREQAARFTLAADISLVGFALFVFAPDPSWAIYACGFVVIASGGFRLRNGALLATASLSLTYVVVMAFRVSALAIPPSAAQVVLHLGGYLIAGIVLNAVLPELDALRERELETYQPILQAEDDAGDALLMTEDGRPIFWNRAFEALTGYGAADLARVPTTANLILVDKDCPAETSDDHRAFRGHVRTRTGTLVDVEVVRRLARANESDRSVWILRDVTSRERAEAKLRDQALHDALTGLPNRTLLDDRLKSAIAVAQRQDAPVSLLLVDLDGFKEVNDTWGHHAGDLVLVEVAGRLSGTLRESDTAARLGGDEFVLLLPSTPMTGAVEAARVLAELIAAPITIDGSSRTVGASIGIAAFPNHGRAAEILLAAADAAMYDAKRSGGGYRVFEPARGSAQK
jgi:diguanylate cyclase (GGDEF)-like protein/PAS domain S-box-containing protein